MCLWDMRKDTHREGDDNAVNRINKGKRERKFRGNRVCLLSSPSPGVDKVLNVGRSETRTKNTLP